MNLIIQAFVLGIIYGLGPCTISCAPVLVPIVMTASKNWKQGLIYTLVFSLGRVIVYVLLGMLMGALGKTLEIYISNKIIGIFFALLGIALFFKVHTRCLVSKVKITGLHMSFVAGIIMGFSPCAPMLAALALAVASKSILIGGLIALVFGVGTVLSPILIIGTVSGKWASIKEFQNINNYVAGVFLFILGLIFFFQ
ncbi:sulfite exporter TauE/SafE family protein [Candidatus Woesearchaeota archaeon]|nr:sulfite exporter TauE/SafE family protein [Candidatus Woesearchaeota archaeon]